MLKSGQMYVICMSRPSVTLFIRRTVGRVARRFQSVRLASTASTRAVIGDLHKKLAELCSLEAESPTSTQRRILLESAMVDCHTLFHHDNERVDAWHREDLQREDDCERREAERREERDENRRRDSEQTNFVQTNRTDDFRIRQTERLEDRVERRKRDSHQIFARFGAGMVSVLFGAGLTLVIQRLSVGTQSNKSR
jgi:hypothetical protein